MKEHTFEVAHAQVLLDVIFGVIIALPLIEVPKVAVTLLTAPDFATGTTFFLTVAALIFASFYWLEVRHFLSEQERFNDAVRRDESIPSDGVPLPLATYLVGSLIMMTLAAGILAFANYKAYRTFLLLNILFWLADLYGTASLKHIYRGYAVVIGTVRHQQPHVYDWFVGHIVTPYFYFYGVANALVFAGLLLADQTTGDTPLWRCLGATIVLAITVFRHGWVRSSLYMKVRDRKLAKANSRDEPVVSLRATVERRLIMATPELPPEVSPDKKYDTVVSSGQSALRALLTLNGGAILAFLAFIGHLLEKRVVPREGVHGFVIALALYVGGTFLTVLAYGIIFLTNVYSRINLLDRSDRFFKATVTLGFTAIAFFLAGSVQAIRTFWSIAHLLSP